MPRETATERRAREAAEARAKEEKWEHEKPMRLLNALARAHDLGLKAYVSYRYDNILYYTFCTDHDQIHRAWCDPVVELSDRAMNSIEAELDEIHRERDRQSYLLTLRAELLSKMTDEEREALGLA
jgi:hypothetical protein